MDLVVDIEIDSRACQVDPGLGLGAAGGEDWPPTADVVAGSLQDGVVALQGVQSAERSWPVLVRDRAEGAGDPAVASRSGVREAGAVVERQAFCVRCLLLASDAFEQVVVVTARPQGAVGE